MEPSGGRITTIEVSGCFQEGSVAVSNVDHRTGFAERLEWVSECFTGNIAGARYAGWWQWRLVVPGSTELDRIYRQAAWWRCLTEPLLSAAVDRPDFLLRLRARVAWRVVGPATTGADTGALYVWL